MEYVIACQGGLEIIVRVLVRTQLGGFIVSTSASVSTTRDVGSLMACAFANPASWARSAKKSAPKDTTERTAWRSATARVNRTPFATHLTVASAELDGRDQTATSRCLDSCHRKKMVSRSIFA